MQSSYDCAFWVLLVFSFLKVLSAKECLSTEYQCHDGQCISIDHFCDGHYDCEDGDDESNCRDFKCTGPLWFECGDGRCINSMLKCNNEFDCKDHSDESLENCPEKTEITCSPDEFTCLNKECILSKWKCDGEPDCLDGSDETIGCDYYNCDGFRCKQTLHLQGMAMRWGG